MSASCLQPTGFPWSEASATGGSSSGGGFTLTTGEPTTTEVNTAASLATGIAASSGGSAAICGDAHVDLGEECDDGDADDADGCTGQCGRDRQIFVTSTLHNGASIQGLAGGDAICREAALAGGLVRPESFKAWLSDSSTDAVARLTPGKGRYVRLDGLVVAESWAGLLSGALVNPVIVTESDTVYESGVWTGTRPDGTRGVGADHCKNWTFADFLDEQNGGFFGYASAVDGVWTYAAEAINPGPCGGELALYCVEQ